MLSPGILIALDVTILYLVMTPLVLYALYVVFDSLGQHQEKNIKTSSANSAKDRSIWSDEGFIQ